MDAKQLAKRQKILAKIQEFTLMDDDFMTVAFDNDIPCTQYVLRIIMQNDTLIVKSVKTQYEIKSLQGRSVRLDVRAEDSSGKIYDIEIQNLNRGAGARRARYNSALMDANALRSSDDFGKLRDTYVIFITENDVMKRGQEVYVYDRTEKVSGEHLGDGTHIIYVNGRYKDNQSEIGRLIHDFMCRSSDDMYNAAFAERARFVKREEAGEMCEVLEEVRAEGHAEGVAEGVASGQRDFVERLIQYGKLTCREIAKLTKLPLSEIEKIAGLKTT